MSRKVTISQPIRVELKKDGVFPNDTIGYALVKQVN